MVILILWTFFPNILNNSSLLFNMTYWLSSFQYSLFNLSKVTSNLRHWFTKEKVCYARNNKCIGVFGPILSYYTWATIKDYNFRMKCGFSRALKKIFGQKTNEIHLYEIPRGDKFRDRKHISVFLRLRVGMRINCKWAKKSGWEGWFKCFRTLDCSAGCTTL